MTEDVSGYVPSREEALTVLFVGVSSDSREAGTFLLARFDPVRGSVPIVTFPASTSVRNGETRQSLVEAYRYGGADLTRRALENTLGISIDRYVRMDEQAFLSAAATVGTVEYDLAFPLELGQGGATLSLSPGIQLLDGQKVAGILGYRGYEGDSELARCATVSDLAATIVNQRIDIALSAVVDKVFEKVINLIDTDISYPDYDNRKEAAQFLARLGKEPAVPITVSGTYREDRQQFELSDTFIALLIQQFT